MAKQPTVTIKVQSAQFQQFVQNFNAFQNNVNRLNAQFQQMAGSVSKVNHATQALVSTMTTLWGMSKKSLGIVKKITGSLIKWSTIVGAIGGLLGVGSFFGIQRLSASILAKRRQSMALGGDYGRTQAGLIAGKSFLDNPAETLMGIRAGLGGDIDKMKPLLSLGIPFGTKMSPDEVLDKVLEKVPEILKRAGPGMELAVAKSYGLDQLFSQQDLMRMSTEEGRKEIEVRREFIKTHKDELTLSDKAQEGWTKLSQQLMLSKASLETTFGESLKDLTTPLSHLSTALVNVVRSIMESEPIKNLLEQLAKWMESFADKIKSLTKEDIDNFIKYITSLLPSMENLEKAMGKFVDVILKTADVIGTAVSGIQAALKVINDLLPKDPSKGDAAATGGGAFVGAAVGGVVAGPVGAVAGAVAGGAVGHGAAKIVEGTGLDPNPVPVDPMSSGAGGVTPGQIKVPGAPPPAGTPPTLAPVPPATPSPPASSGPSFFQRFWPFSSSSGTSSLFGGATPSVPTPAPSPDSDAAKKMVPDSGKKSKDDDIDFTQPSTMPSPLTENNWQMNRVANLTIRNVPGANVFLTSAGMTG